MRVKADDRLKVKQYRYERKALSEFIDQYAAQFSVHVKHAAVQRLGVVDRELKILGVRDSESTEQPSEAEAAPLPFEPTDEELQAAYSYELTNDDQEIVNRVTTQLKKAVSEE